MSDCIYTLGPYPHPTTVSLKESDGTKVAAVSLPPGRVYTYVGDPGLVVTARKSSKSRAERGGLGAEA